MASTNTPESSGNGNFANFWAEKRDGAYSGAWEELWNAGKSFWDRGMPSPALLDLIESGQLGFPCAEEGRRPKALVPGCGRGYDVVMLALHGFDAYGLDIAETGVKAAEAYATQQLQHLLQPADCNFGASFDRSRVERGQVAFRQGDFFARDWEMNLVPDGVTKFDLIYDYTFLCALHPEMRKDWTRRMHSLLEPTGVLVCLEFPLFKDASLPGPPWGLAGVYWSLLAEGGDGIVNERAAEKDEDAVKSSKGSFERVLHIKPKRTYEQGKDTDRLSVWRLSR